jgi:branched-chain amino acid transport system ATP-binding protein
VGELSHGDQRATEIMMALALKPRLLLLDEPTAGMGDQETYDITRLIRKLHRDQRLSIVLIEHDMRVIFHLAERIMVLAEGAVLAEGTPADIAANDKVQAAYLGKATCGYSGRRRPDGRRIASPGSGSDSCPKGGASSPI